MITALQIVNCHFMKEISKIPCRKSITSTLVELGQDDKDIIVVTSDATGSATLDDFVKTLPEQFVEVGIAEQNSVGIAAGLASTASSTRSSVFMVIP